MAYRGPNANRIGAQQAQIAEYAGETGVWRQYVSASSGSGSAYFAGIGTTPYYNERVITGLWAAAQGAGVGESRFRETQLPGGQVLASDVLISTIIPLGSADEVVWRGTIYRVESDAIPMHMGGRPWFVSVLRRGDVTG